LPIKNKILFLKQTTQETVRFPFFSKNYVVEKNSSRLGSFFLFLSCIW